MIRLHHITVRLRCTSEAVLSELTQIHPKGLSASGSVFKLFGMTDDDIRLYKTRKVFNEHGISPINPFEKERSNSYRYSTSIKYEPEDIKQADYFRFDLDYDGVETIYDEQAGDLRVYAHELKKGSNKHRLLLDNGSSNGLMVPDKVKRRLESVGFSGLMFMPLDACNRKGKLLSWDTVKGGPYWHTSSGIILPRLHPDCKEVDGNGSPWDEETSKTGVYLIEDIFPVDELRYRESDIRLLGDFDIAITRETFGISTSAIDRQVIVSSDMREAIQKLETKITWAPVYIEKDA